MIRNRRSAAVLTGAVLALLPVLTGCGATDTHGRNMSPTEPGMATVGGGPDSQFRGLEPSQPFARPTFTLTDRSGSLYDFGAQTAGKLTLLFFGYTNCPDVCPTTLANIAVALRNVDPAMAERVAVVFVTTDPARDDPETLGAYLDRFDADLPVSFIGLSGDQADVEAAQREAGVPVAEEEGQVHSTLLLLFGHDDLARVAFLAGSTPDDITHDLEVVAGQ